MKLSSSERLRSVSEASSRNCVTAEENYRLEMIETTGLTGPDKYAKAGVEFVTPDLPWTSGALRATTDRGSPLGRAS